VSDTSDLGHIIEEYFGKGEQWGVNINYIKEAAPLGTSGALSLLKKRPNKPFVVTNGDVITDINYGNVLDFHCKSSSIATMAVRQYELQNPFGVVQIDGLDIVGFEEKPVVKSNINAGVYVLNPNVLDYIEKDTYCDMPNLFESLRLDGKSIKAYLAHEEWMDIGRSYDLEKANKR
jgi:NDP-sugar pyrophosphorylase family protein